MGITVISLGHGGGVPAGAVGNTNFAIFANLDAEEGTPVDQILAEHDYWLVDCGPATVARITGGVDGVAKVPDPRVSHCKGVILTHMHNDHAGGIIPLAYRTMFVEQTRAQLFVPEAAHQLLVWQCVELYYSSPWFLERRGRDLNLQTYYEVTQMHPRGEYTAEPFTVRSFPVDHGFKDFPCFGVALTLGDTTVVFSGDTAKPLDSKWFKEADGVYHDVQFYNDGTKPNLVHCPYPALKAAVSPEKRGEVYLSHTQQMPPPYAHEDGFRWASLNLVRTFKGRS